MRDVETLSAARVPPHDGLAGRRVLHVCESLPGGPASYLQEILPHQAAMLGRDAVAVLAPQDQLGHLGQAAPDRVWGYERKGRGLGSILALRRALLEVMAEFDPDIVHLHSSFAGAVGRLALPRGAGRPRVLYCAHGWAFDDSRETKMRGGLSRVERALASRTDIVINISPHEMGLLKRRGFPDPKVRLVVSGLKNETPLPGPASRPDDHTVTLLFVGRFDRQKGLDLLLAEMARPECANVRLLVAGANVLAQAGLGELPENVTPLGWVDRAKIPELMAGVDAVIMPSRWEGMPLVALETLRAGRPLLASRRGPFEHIVDDGRTGVLMDIDRPGFLAEALGRAGRSELAAMGRAAREAFEANYSSARMNNELMDLYAEVLRP
jgi:glycosyltransferase involved in cell wall biosynthesis